MAATALATSKPLPRPAQPHPTNNPSHNVSSRARLQKPNPRPTASPQYAASSSRAPLAPAQEPSPFVPQLSDGLSPLQNAPPSYEMAVRNARDQHHVEADSSLAAPAAAQTRRSRSRSASASSARNSSGFRPLVIPQTTRKVIRGPMASPFVRAWAPELEAYNICQEDFLAFLDGVNECFIQNPVLTYGGFAAAGLNFVPLASAQIIAFGVQTGIGMASFAISYARTRAYVKTANEKLFRPQGLRCNIVKTKKMMSAVGVDGDKLQLPPLETMDPGMQEHLVEENMEDGLQVQVDDPRMRRVKALGDKVMDITLDVPAAESPDNWLRKMGDWQAQRSAAKQEKKMLKQREKMQEKYDEQTEKGDKERRKADKEIGKQERKADKERRKAAKELRKAGDSSREAAKIQKELDKELGKIQKDIDKANRKVEKEGRKATKEQAKVDKEETKIANKIYWIVIHRDDQGPKDDEEVSGASDYLSDDEDGDLSDSDDEESRDDFKVPGPQGH